MPEGLGPGPEDIEPDDSNHPSEELVGFSENDLALISAERQAREELALEGIEVNDPETRLLTVLVGEAMPKMPPGTFKEDEVVTGPDGREYTTEGLLTWKVIDRENYLSQHAQELYNLRSGIVSYTPGMICVTGKSNEQRIGKITDVTLEKDPKHDKGARKTGVVVTAAFENSSTEVFRYEGLPTPLYHFVGTMRPRQLPESLAAELSIEHNGLSWSVGDYFSLNAEPSYIGKIALIPNQEQYPGQVGVMLRDRESRAEIYLVKLDDISERNPTP